MRILTLIYLRNSSLGLDYGVMHSIDLSSHSSLMGSWSDEAISNKSLSSYSEQVALENVITSTNSNFNSFLHIFMSRLFPKGIGSTEHNLKLLKIIHYLLTPNTWPVNSLLCMVNEAVFNQDCSAWISHNVFAAAENRKTIANIPCPSLL